MGPLVLLVLACLCVVVGAWPFGALLTLLAVGIALDDGR